MKRRRIHGALLLAGLALLGAVALSCRSAVWASGPTTTWYDDVPAGYWAFDEIYSLWGVGVTDGWPLTIWTPHGFDLRASFRPDEPAERVAYAVMLAKAFSLEPADGSLPYTDVPPVLTVYNRFSARPWLVSAWRAGVLGDNGGHLFRPHAHIYRGRAVAWLVRALGLEGFARGMSPADVEAFLQRFRDAYTVADDIRPEVAAAVRLGILVGFPDGTLRANQSLTRAQAAALINRSAWVRVRADPPTISPDGDGISDSTQLSAVRLNSGAAVTWRLTIQDARGVELSHPRLGRTIHGVHAAAVWDGRRTGGQALPPGTYYVVATILHHGPGIHRRSSVPVPITIVVGKLSASLAPQHVLRGGRVTVSAIAGGDPKRVAAKTPWNSFALHKSGEAAGQSQWQASFQIPGGAALGTHSVGVQATFGDGAVRTVQLTVVVVSPPETPPGDPGSDQRGDVDVVLTGVDPF